MQMQMEKISLRNNENKKSFHRWKYKDLSVSLSEDFNAFKTFPMKKAPAISALAFKNKLFWS